MEGGFLLNVIIRKSSAIFQLLSSEDQSLLIRRDSFLVLDLLLDVLDGITGLDFQSDRLPGESFDEDLHSSSQTKDQMEGGFFLDVVIGEGSSVF